ncbi:Hypothetical protein A7982_03709 [Minicystis rosea]|nr:Hypothetical protein A7982_03709 [Minicystis rosea]
MAVTIAGIGLLAGGCAPPAKFVTAITNSHDQIKFLYVQGPSQGIVKCAVGPGGALTQCREMAVSLED